MPQSLAVNLIHLVFSTKNRKPLLVETVRPELFAYQAGVLEKWNSPALRIGGEADHVHILFRLSKNYPLSKVVEEVKKSSSKWMKTRTSSSADFAWQNGYAAFSVSQSRVSDVERYIQQQPDHHRAASFREELRLLLGRHGLEYDERYLWD